jgi:hypothetical protein
MMRPMNVFSSALKDGYMPDLRKDSFARRASSTAWYLAKRSVSDLDPFMWPLSLMLRLLPDIIDLAYTSFEIALPYFFFLSLPYLAAASLTSNPTPVKCRSSCFTTAAFFPPPTLPVPYQAVILNLTGKSFFVPLSLSGGGSRSGGICP